MRNKGLIIFIIFGISMVVLVFVGTKTEVIGEQLCVDGESNINLEGIMCEKSETTFFGYPAWTTGLIIPITILVFILTLWVDLK